MGAGTFRYHRKAREQAARAVPPAAQPSADTKPAEPEATPEPVVSVSVPPARSAQRAQQRHGR